LVIGFVSVFYVDTSKEVLGRRLGD